MYLISARGTLTRRTRLSTVFALMLVSLPQTAVAGPITVAAVADTFVTQHAGLDGPTSTHGADAQLWTILGASAGVQARPLLLFDLSGFGGSVVTGAGTLDLFVDAFHNSAPPGSANSIDVRLIVSAWGESTANWDNQPPSGALLDTEVILTSEVGTRQSWTIPQAVLQSWIDAPGTNFGVMLLSTTAIDQRDVVFSSREGSNSPQLNFILADEPGGVVPEPTSLLLLGTGLSLAAVRRRRMRSHPGT